jgi:hypothetical protein
LRRWRPASPSVSGCPAAATRDEPSSLPVSDEYGEYPVFVLDVDDMPCMELLYPGFDVYLADTASLVEHSYPRDEFESYSKLMKHPTYGARMATHAWQILNGEIHLTRPF